MEHKINIQTPIDSASENFCVIYYANDNIQTLSCASVISLPSHGHPNKSKLLFNSCSPFYILFVHISSLQFLFASFQDLHLNSLNVLEKKYGAYLYKYFNSDSKKYYLSK